MIRPLFALAAAILVCTAAAPFASALTPDRYTVHMWRDGSGDHYEVLDSSGAPAGIACTGVIPSPTGSGVEVRCSPTATSCADPEVTGEIGVPTLGGFPIPIFPGFPSRLEVNGSCQNTTGPGAVASCIATVGVPCANGAVGTTTGTITTICHVKYAFAPIWDATCSYELA